MITGNMDTLLPVVLAVVAGFLAYQTVVAVIGAVTAAQAALNAVMTANPIGLIVAALAALVGGLLWAYNNVDWFRGAVDAAWDGIQTVIDFAWNSVIKPIWDAIYQAIQNYLIPIIQAYWAVYQAIWNAIVAIVQWAWNTVIKPIWDAIYAFVQDQLIPALQQYWEWVQTAWNGIATIVQWAWDAVLFPIFNGIWTWIQNNLIPAVQQLRDWMQTAWEGVSTAIQFAWDSVISPVFNAIKDFVEGTLMPLFDRWLQVVTTIWNGVSSVISTVWNTAISPTFDAIKQGIGFLIDAFNTIKDGISNALSAVYEVIVSPFRTAFNAIANLWNSTLGGFSFSTPDVPGTDWGGIDITIPKMPTFHTGGWVPGAPGQEVLALLMAGEHVTSAADAAAGRFGPDPWGGGGNVYVDVTYPGASAYEIGKAVQFEMAVSR